MLLVLLALCLAPAACSPDAARAPDDAEADTRTLEERLRDASTATQIRKALLDTLTLRPFDFEPDVRQGRVALRGTVRTDEERRLAEALARAVPGVHALTSEIVLRDTTQAADSTGRSRPR